MAAPNIVNVSSIYGRTSVTALTTSYQEVVFNDFSSGKVYKVNTIIAGNVDGSAAADVNVRVKHSNGEQFGALASTISVPADSTLVVLNKSTSIYLEEGWAIEASASAAGDIQLTVSYEVIG